MVSIYKRITRNASLLFGANTLTAIMGFIALIILANTLGAEQFGLFILAQSYIVVFSQVVCLQTWQPAVKYIENLKNSNLLSEIPTLISKLFYIDLFLSITGVVIGYLIIYILVKVNILDKYDAAVLCIFLFSVLVNISGAFNGYLRAFDKFKTISLIQLAFSSFRLLAILALSLNGSSIFSMAVAWVLSETLNHALTVYFAATHYKHVSFSPFRLPFKSNKMYPGLKNFLFSNHLDMSFRVIPRNLDVIAIGYLVGKEAVGIYKLAIHLSSIPLRFSDPIYNVLLPEFCRLVDTNLLSKARKLLFTTISVGGLAFLFAYLIFLLFGEALIAATLSSSYFNTFAIMKIYLIAVGLNIIGQAFIPYFHALSKPRECMYIQLLATMGYILCLYPLVFAYHATGAAVSYILYYVIWLLLAFALYWRFR